jgi:hypothetical protein
MTVCAVPTCIGVMGDLVGVIGRFQSSVWVVDHSNVSIAINRCCSRLTLLISNLLCREAQTEAIVCDLSCLVSYVVAFMRMRACCNKRNTSR